MRGVRVIVALGLALLASGCDPNDASYFRGGIGTDLYTADIGSTTELQNIYLDNLCRQSKSFVGAAVPSCAQEMIPINAWPVMVQAGLNDIDARCDSYLAWLDQKRRENAGILTEIGAVRFAVDALTNPAVVTVSPVALAAVAAAFGLATNTVNNFNSLLLQVDHTTVQSVVFVNRRVFRENLLNLPIDNKPMAVHALRSYLTICMPMTISANINSTVTVFQQAGPNAIDPQQMVSTSTIRRPITAQQTITQPSGPTPIVHPEFTAILDPYDPKTQDAALVRSIQEALCVPNGEIGTKRFDDTTVQITIYQATKAATISTVKVTGKLNNNKEIGEVLGSRRCAKDANGVPTGPRNFFEKQTFNSNPRGVQELANFIAVLNAVPGGTQKVTGTSLDSARARIKEVRGLPSISSQLTLDLPTDFAGQVTPDLFQAVSKK